MNEIMHKRLPDDWPEFNLGDDARVRDVKGIHTAMRSPRYITLTRARSWDITEPKNSHFLKLRPRFGDFRCRRSVGVIQMILGCAGSGAKRKGKTEEIAGNKRVKMRLGEVIWWRQTNVFFAIIYLAQKKNSKQQLKPLFSNKILHAWDDLQMESSRLNSGWWKEEEEAQL